jgi:hypothetical protein
MIDKEEASSPLPCGHGAFVGRTILSGFRLGARARPFNSLPRSHEYLDNEELLLAPNFQQWQGAHLRLHAYQ